jgi:lysozyme
MSDALELALPRVKQAEGYRQFPYKDTVGVSTIGYGCALDVGWPEPFAAAVCRLQLENADAACRQLDFYADLDTVRQSVILEMMFNLGPEKLSHFVHLFASIRAKDYVAAAQSMLDSKWAMQVKGRAVRLAALMQKGTDA